MDRKALPQIFEEHNGKVSDKWYLYLGEYEKLFQEYRNKKINVLEIGIQNGGSLEIWAKYFENANRLVGVDINERCGELLFDDERISVIVGDANQDRTFEKVVEISESFEIIIDDGSHKSSDIIRSFCRYFPLLTSGGIYIVEDLHASYWKDFEGSLYNPLTAISFFKRLADLVNFEHWRLSKTRLEHLKPFVQNYTLDLTEFDLLGIHSVEFINSICIVRKSTPDQTSLGYRVVAGQEENITTHIRKLNKTSILDFVYTVEEDKEWDVFEIRKDLSEIEQALAGLRAEMEASRERASGLEAQLAERKQQNTALTLQKAALQQELEALRAHQQEREQILQDLNSKLLEIYSSTAWKIIQWMWRVRLWMFPRGSWRERIGRKLLFIVLFPFTKPVVNEVVPNKALTPIMQEIIPDDSDFIKPTDGRKYETLRDNNSSYLILRQEVLNSGFWDEKWYLSKYYKDYLDSRRNKSSEDIFLPLDYYLQEGWKLGHEPSNLLPIRIDQDQVGCSKIEYFLKRLRFDGYHFDENIWIPSEKIVEEYLNQKQHRNSKRVIYTCIVRGYDNLIQHYFISPDWDYVCFTDDPDLIDKGSIGIWEIRPLANKLSSATRTNRWHKIHPHVLFQEYQESIYVDGNINIIGDYVFEQIQKRCVPILLPEHFKRNCVYQEIEALLRSSRISDEDKSLLIRYRQFLQQEGFPKEFGLSENNLIYRKHHVESIVNLMREWWIVYENYSSRDQVSLPYVFWKNGMLLRPHMLVNCRVNYQDFWMIKHTLGSSRKTILKGQALTPAFNKNNIAVVFSTNEQYIPYLGVAIYSLIKNSSDNFNYDIVILAKGLEAELAKVCELSRGLENISIRIYDTTKLMESLSDVLHVEGYVPVETYNKCFITEILSGYERCVYLDSDIVILDDIQKLHDIDLKGHAIGASVNVANVYAANSKKTIKGRRFDEYLEKDLGILDKSKYFQAGVVVLDMKKLYRLNMWKLTFDAIEKLKKPIFFDQDIYNYIFYGDVCFFSTEWNHVWYMQQYSYLRGFVPDDVFFDYAHSRVDPKIIHYASKDKPQNRLGWALADYFWRYAYESPFINDIKNKIINEKNDLTPIVAAESNWEWSRVKPRLLVHLHFYYLDQLEVMVDSLKNITDCNYDLFVTIVEKNDAVEKGILSVSENARFILLPNLGYDVYPFLNVLNHVQLSNYDFVLKLHTKNARGPEHDTVYGIKVPGYQWRDELLNAIVGSKEIFRKNLKRLLEDKTLGCIGAGKFIFSTEENNEEITYSLAEWRRKCGVVGGSHYVGGSMFLARAYPFEHLKGLNLKPKDFESPHMATSDHKNLAHIIERLFGIVIESEGFEIRGETY